MSSVVFSPLRAGPTELPNRLALAPVKTAFGRPDGLVTDRHVAYYRRRAAGGAGLIVTDHEHVCLHRLDVAQRV